MKCPLCNKGLILEYTSNSAEDIIKYWHCPISNESVNQYEYSYTTYELSNYYEENFSNGKCHIIIRGFKKNIYESVIYLADDKFLLHKIIQTFNNKITLNDIQYWFKRINRLETLS